MEDKSAEYYRNMLDNLTNIKGGMSLPQKAPDVTNVDRIKDYLSDKYNSMVNMVPSMPDEDTTSSNYHLRKWEDSMAKADQDAENLEIAKQELAMRKDIEEKKARANPKLPPQMFTPMNAMPAVPPVTPEAPDTNSIASLPDAAVPPIPGKAASRSPGSIGSSPARKPAAIDPTEEKLKGLTGDIQKLQAEADAARSMGDVEGARKAEDRARAMEMVLGGIGDFSAGFASNAAGSQVGINNDYLKKITDARKGDVADAVSDRKTKIDDLKDKLAMLRGQKTDIMGDDQFGREKKAFDMQTQKFAQEMQKGTLDIGLLQGQLNNAKDMDKKDSIVAQVFQEAAKNKYPKIFKDKDISGLSANQVSLMMDHLAKGGSLEDMEYKLASLGIRDHNSKRADKALDWRMDEKDKGRQREAQKDYDKDKAVVASVDALAKAQGAEEFIKNGSPMALEVVSRALSRLSGESGVLTDNDVNAFRAHSPFSILLLEI
jgi:hypothetical protein